MSNNSLYGQAAEDGGILDWTLDDIKGNKLDNKKKLNQKQLTSNKHLIRYCPHCGKSLPNMNPR